MSHATLRVSSLVEYMVISVRTKCWKMLKFWTKKWKCSENKAFNCKCENVYLHGQSVPWLSVFAVSDYIDCNIVLTFESEPNRKMLKCQPVQNEGFVFYWILVVTGWKSCCCIEYA